MHSHSTQLPLALETEEWRPVVGYEGWYEVSNLGMVRRVKSGKSVQIGRPLRQYRDHNGYLVLALTQNGSGAHFKVHRLVAKAFLPPSRGRNWVNHRDGDKTNNRVHNLEWTTRAENMRHAVATGLFAARGMAHYKAKLNEGDVRAIRAIDGQISQPALASMYGVSRSTISDIQRRQTWRHVP
jgi:hypothetical protein